jgi:poly(3-hydroxybutyrate) depolymerase
VNVRRISALVASALLFLVCGCVTVQPAGPSCTTDDEPIYDIPHVTGITVDGDLSDWGNCGFSVRVMRQFAADPVSPSDFDPVFRLAWNEEGLFVLCRVDDDDIVEDEDLGRVWATMSDCVGVYVIPERGELSGLRAVVSPGASENRQDTRVAAMLWRGRGAKGAKAVVRAEGKRTTCGYVVEICIPWQQDELKVAPGMDFGCQVFVVDADSDEEGILPAMWFPKGGASVNTKNTHVVRFSEHASLPVAASVAGEYENMLRTSVRIVARLDHTGQVVKVSGDAGTVLGEGALEERNGWASCRLTFPPHKIGEPFGVARAMIRERQIAVFKLPDFDELREQKLRDADLEFRAVFTGEELPEFRLADSGWIETLVGPYTIEVTYYNAAQDEVTSADEPGRYGAVVTLNSAVCGPIVRYFSLFKQPVQFEWWHSEWDPFAGTIPDLPEEWGIDPLVVGQQRDMLADFVRWELMESIYSEPSAAPVLAGLYESDGDGPPTVMRTDVWAKDDRWWYEVRKKRGEVKTQYLLHVPDAYYDDDTEEWPLIVFLHGGGESGTDPSVIQFFGPPARTLEGWQSPFIILSPQSPGEWHRWIADEVIELLDRIVGEYRVDADRIYLTGLSYGGHGTWTVSSEYPDKFAALVPICGWGDVRDVERIKNIPTWIFHGEKDESVNVDASREMYEALKQAGGTPTLTLYPELDHYVWEQTYNSDALYEWLLSNRRGEPATLPPTNPVNSETQVILQ